MEPEVAQDTAHLLPELLAKPVRREERVAALLADWRQRWPAVFTASVPLAIGMSRQIREQLDIPRKEIGIALHHWTMRTSYLHTVVQGVSRRNLDGSEAGAPDEVARQKARELLRERTQRYRAKAAEKADKDKTRTTQTAEAPTQAIAA